MDKEGQRVENPMFPNVEVWAASNEAGTTAVVVSLTDDDRTVNAIMPLKMAIEIGKQMIGTALAEMTPEEIEEIDDDQVVVMRVPEGKVN